MVFDSQGLGVYYMADIEIPFEWGWQSDFEIVFIDALGDYFIGTAAGDLVIGVYYVELEDGLHEFEYVLRKTAENGSTFAPALPQGVEIPTQGRAYNALCCLRDGTPMECESDGLKLNADGTGTLAYNGKDYDIRWAQNGAEFSFIDQNDDDFEGIAVGDVIHGVYTITFSDGNVLQYEYVFETAMAN